MIKELDYKGYTIRIEYDTDYEHEEEENFLTIRTRNWRVGEHDTKAELAKAYPFCPIYPVYAYIHGGIALSLGEFSCPWDSGQVGLIAIPRWVKPEDREAWAKSYLEEMDDVLNGNVYGYIVEDSDGEALESCWGFVGDPDGYILEEAKGVVDFIVERARKARQDRIKDLIPYFRTLSQL